MKTIKDFENLPDSAMVRAAQLIGNKSSMGLIPIGNSTFYRYVQQGKFPKPTKLSNGVAVWTVGEVRKWLAAQGVKV